MGIFSVVTGILKLRGKSGNIIDSVTDSDGSERLLVESAPMVLQTTSFDPDPANQVSEVREHLRVNSSGSLQVRGAVYTDEASFRDDFVGPDLITNLTGTMTFTQNSTTVTGVGTYFTTELSKQHLIRFTSDSNLYFVMIENIISDTELELSDVYAGTGGTGTGVWSFWMPNLVSGGSATIVSSKINLVCNTTNGAVASIYRYGDYGPFSLSFAMSMSQRIANQDFHIGFTDSEGTGSSEIELIFQGTDNTKVTFETKFGNETETSTLSLPGGLVTSSNLKYDIQVSADRASVFVENVFIGEHHLHVPFPYQTMDIYARLRNTGTTASTTTVVLDVLAFNNFNQVEVSMRVKSDPLPIRVVEDIHTISSYLTSTSTTPNQVILQYTVPAGKSFWIVGYTVSNGETNIRGNPIRIGRNTMTAEPASPGVVDHNVFRAFNMPASTFRDEQFSYMPRLIGMGGDQIKMTVTPTGGTTTIWRASIDFVLR